MITFESVKTIELKLNNSKEIYKEISNSLYPYRKEPQGSILFIVEGTKKKPVIGIRYPGRKLRKRELKIKNVNSALWANLYDFEVIIFSNNEAVDSNKFTFQNIMKDFQEHKRSNKEFWKLIEALYYKYKVNQKPPKLPGIDSELFLKALKWIWIQEDFNYKLDWEEVASPEKYILETRTGTRTSKGAGRAKFFAALVLLNYGFTFDQVKKIIPLY